jgi:predicted MFS family arabinose efflux permease
MYSWWQSVVLYIVLIAQDVHHLNAMQTAVRFVPMGFFGAATSIITGRIVHRYSIRTLLAFGMLVCTVTLIPACVMSPHTSFWISVFPSAILGVIGVSIAYNTASM